MSEEYRVVLAGFGGQGILFAGKVLAYTGLIDDREVSWMPSYGPEMRGGTANCSVTLSDEPIGSPLVVDPNVLLCMNQPSLDKFIDDVTPGGVVVVDKTLINHLPQRDDVKLFAIDATTIAEEHGLKGLANIICLGKIYAETKFASMETVEAAINKVVPPRKAHLIEKNIEAFKLGMTL